MALPGRRTRGDAVDGATASAPPGLRLRSMTAADLDHVLAIEVAAYPFPWSRGNFTDSLAAGYLAQVLVNDRQNCVAYCIAMAGVQECHLLNLAVDPTVQGLGHGSWLLRHLASQRAALGDESLWLEVRESNQRAHALYLRLGFTLVGRRRGYYPAPRGQREDALVMSLNLNVSQNLSLRPDAPMP